MSTTRPARALVDALLGAPAAVLLAFVLFGMVNYLGARHYRRLDCTRQKLFTLSPRSREIAHDLRGPTDMYIFVAPGESFASDVNELAQRYAAESPMIRVHRIDPDRERDRMLDLVRRLGLRTVASTQADQVPEAAIVLVRAERHYEILREKLVAVDQGEEGSTSAPQVLVTVERAVSEAMQKLERNEATLVCFASGHGELPLQGSDESVSALVADLAQELVTARAVEVRGTESIPDECRALVIAGPRQAYTPGDAAIVDAYLTRGGNVFMLLDPMFVERHHVATGLESIAHRAGIELTSSIAIETDAAHAVPSVPPWQFTATALGEHPITRTYRGSGARVLVSTSRVLRRATDVAIVPESLVRTTANAWGETSAAGATAGDPLARGPDDIAGPLDLGMAAQVLDLHPPRPIAPGLPAGRVVVLGSSYYAQNEVFSPNVQNAFLDAALTSACIGWVTERRELVQIPARPVAGAAFAISADSLRYITLYVLLAVPAAAALIGFAVTRARKAV